MERKKLTQGEILSGANILLARLFFLMDPLINLVVPAPGSKWGSNNPRRRLSSAPAEKVGSWSLTG